MSTLSYAEGAHIALVKLGLAATTENLLGRILRRGAAGAGVGAVTSGMLGGGLLSGAATGAAGGILLGGLPRGERRVPLTENQVSNAPARLERLQNYLSQNVHSPMAKELAERAYNKDLTLGGIGGLAGGAAGYALNKPNH